MYLLEMQQGDRSHRLGLFKNKEEALDWIGSIPYVKKRLDYFGDIEFISYTMDYKDLPLYEEIKWKATSSPFSKYMFTPDGGGIEIFVWERLSIIGETPGYAEGMTQVDAYMIPNSEVAAYIKDREGLRKALTNYYHKLGRTVESGGLGSQDGEYLLVEDGPLIHLDAYNVNYWRDNPHIEDLIEGLL